MSEFIKLTCVKNNDLLWVHRDEIGYVACAKEDDYVFTEMGLRCLGATGCHRVQETPEEIMALLRNDELPAANKALKAANEILFDTLTAKTVEIDDFTGRLSRTLQLNYELGSQLAESHRDRDRLQHKLNSILITAK